MEQLTQKRDTLKQLNTQVLEAIQSPEELETEMLEGTSVLTHLCRPSADLQLGNHCQDCYRLEYIMLLNLPIILSGNSF